jgi:hypothetical protein
MTTKAVQPSAVAQKRFEKWAKEQPHCIGCLGGCGGDIAGTEHEEDCPMSKEPNSTGRRTTVTPFSAYCAGAAEANREAYAAEVNRDLLEALALRDKEIEGLIEAIEAVAASAREALIANAKGWVEWPRSPRGRKGSRE